MTKNELIAQYDAITGEAEAYFKRPDVEADWRSALRQPEYLALVGRFNNANTEAKASGLTRNDVFFQYSDAYRGLRAYKKLKIRLKARLHAQTRQRPPLKTENIFASDVQKEYGVTPAKLHVIADKIFYDKLSYWGLESNLCDYNYDGAHWDAHKCEVEQAKLDGKVVCICQIDRAHPMYPSHPLGEGHFYGRKVYSRSAIVELITNEKLRRTEKVISSVPSPTPMPVIQETKGPVKFTPSPMQMPVFSEKRKQPRLVKNRDGSCAVESEVSGQ
jgi:hypothetical protein